MLGDTKFKIYELFKTRLFAVLRERRVTKSNIIKTIHYSSFPEHSEGPSHQNLLILYEAKLLQ